MRVPPHSVPCVRLGLPLLIWPPRTYKLTLLPRVNPRLRDLVLRVEGREDNPVPQPGPLPTPWTDILTERGFYKPDDDSDSD